MSLLQKFRQNYQDNKRLMELVVEMREKNTTLDCFPELVTDYYKGELGLKGLKVAAMLLSKADQIRFASDPSVPPEVRTILRLNNK